MMKKLYFGLSLLLALGIYSCTEDSAFEENPGFVPTATGDNPQIPADGSGNGNVIDSTGNGTDTTGGGGDPSLMVEAVQRATVTYVGATWCPPCGAYGDPTKKFMEDNFGQNVSILNIQSGDAISSQSSFGYSFGRVFFDFDTVNSIPHAWWSGANYDMVHRGFFVSASSNNIAAENDINAIVNSLPDVGVAAKATMITGAVSVEYNTKFYTALSEAYVGVYLLEDSVMENQKITGAPDAVTQHDNVMRGAAFTGNDLGIESIGTSISQDQEITGSHTIAIPTTVRDMSKLQVAVVIWESDKANGISNSIIVDIE